MRITLKIFYNLIVRKEYLMKKISFASAILGLSLFGAASASEMVTIYYSPSCPYCHYARDDISGKLVYEFPNLSVTEIDVSNPENHPMFSYALKKCGLKSGGVPLVVYGDKCEQGYSDVFIDEVREMLSASLNEEEKTLVAANRKAMETDANAFKARNADRKKAVVKYNANSTKTATKGSEKRSNTGVAPRPTKAQ